MKKIRSRHTVTAVTSLVITINLRNPEINYNNLLELSGKTFHFLLVVYQGLDVEYSTWIQAISWCTGGGDGYEFKNGS